MEIQVKTMAEQRPMPALLRATQYLQRQPLTLHVSAFAIFFILVAFLDLVLDRDLSLYAFYLIPALYATWFLGARWGYSSCVASAVVWLIDDLAGPQGYDYTFIPYWNLATRATVLLFIVAVVGFLKSALEHTYQLERQQVQKEYDIAREVQLRLLPLTPPSYPGLDFGCVYKPAQLVGGDYYDFIPLSRERVGIAVADVSGKGLSSALLMASLQGLMHNYPASYKSEISAFVTRLSASLYELTANNRYATLFFMIVDPKSQTVEYVNAGHNPPLLFRNEHPPGCGARAESLSQGGPPVGILPRSQYQSDRVVLREGDVLVAYTDGVTDAQNSLREEFGKELLYQAVEDALSLTAVEIGERVSERLRVFVGESPQFDDITLVIMKVRSVSPATR